MSPRIFFDTVTLQKSQFSKKKFEIFSKTAKGPLQFFLMFQQTGYSKSSKNPSFTILKTSRLSALDIARTSTVPGLL